MLDINLGTLDISNYKSVYVKVRVKELPEGTYFKEIGASASIRAGYKEWSV